MQLYEQTRCTTLVEEHCAKWLKLPVYTRLAAPSVRWHTQPEMPAEQPADGDETKQRVALFRAMRASAQKGRRVSATIVVAGGRRTRIKPSSRNHVRHQPISTYAGKLS